MSFSIAEPYDSMDDYWSYKGVQAWGNAKVYSQTKNPKRFNDALKKMKKGKRKKLSLNQMATIWDNPADHVDVAQIETFHRNNFIEKPEKIMTF